MKVRIGDVCTVVSGNTPKTSNPEFWDGDIDWITPAELTDDSYMIFESARKITKDAVIKTGIKPFPEGTVILSSRAPIGKVAIAGKEMYCNQGFKNLICGEKINNAYLFWFLRSKTEFLNTLGRGATFKEISKSIVENIEINLPTVDKQKKYAKILKMIWDVITLRRQQLAALDELIKSQFIEWFGDPVSNEKGWPMVKLNSVAEIRIGPFGSLLHKEDYIGGGHALINPSHIIDGQIVPDDKLTVSDEKYDMLSAYHLENGDIVLGRRGEMGRCAVVTRSGLLCGTGSMIIRAKGELQPFFLQRILSSPSYRTVIESKAVGVTMMNINVPIVSSLLIPLLPTSLQEEYIKFVRQSDKSKVVIQKALNETQTLLDSLMQQYFG